MGDEPVVPETPEVTPEAEEVAPVAENATTEAPVEEPQA